MAESIVGNLIAQWGTFGIVLVVAGWIIYINVKSKIAEKKNPTQIKTIGQKMDNLFDAINNIDSKVDILDEKFEHKFEMVNKKIEHQDEHFIDNINVWKEKANEKHGHEIVDRLKLGPQLHKILGQYRNRINSEHVFIGYFHNGTTSLSGIPYYKCDIIAEKFDPDININDTEFAPMYKDSDILRHNLLPMLLVQKELLYYKIDENGESELDEIDNIIYRGMIGMGIKQLAMYLLKDTVGYPAGFVGCVKYNYDKINLEELKNCAVELEECYKENDEIIKEKLIY